MDKYSIYYTYVATFLILKIKHDLWALSLLSFQKAVSWSESLNLQISGTLYFSLSIWRFLYTVNIKLHTASSSSLNDCFYVFKLFLIILLHRMSTGMWYCSFDIRLMLGITFVYKELSWDCSFHPIDKLMDLYIHHLVTLVNISYLNVFFK